MNIKDIFLILLYIPGKTGKFEEGIEGRTRIVKMMFLFEKEIKDYFKEKIKGEPNFISWKYGPYSKDIIDMVEFFKNLGFINEELIEDDVSKADFEEYNKWIEDSLSNNNNDDVKKKYFVDPSYYQITDLGESYIKEKKLMEALTESQLKLLIKFKEKITQLSLYAILQYIYKKYSKFTDKSLIKDDVIV